jgi:hypothetical protein
MGRRLSPDERRELAVNVFANDFFQQSKTVREDLGVDYLAGITPSMIAFEDKTTVYWNYFCISKRELILVSSYDVRRYAREASRPFEVGLAALFVAQVLSELNPRVEFHDDRGCLFDFNSSRESLVDSLKELRIEPTCLKKMLAAYRTPAEALVDAMRSYTPASSEAHARPDRVSTPRNDAFWLRKLNELARR